MHTPSRRIGKRLAGLGALGAAGALLAAPLAHATTAAPTGVSAAADPAVTARGPGTVTTAPLTTDPAPTTDAPTTDAPASLAPTTDAPTTDAPTTDAPPTDAPTSEAPTTPAPLPTISIPTLIPLPTLSLPMPTLTVSASPAPTTTTPAPPLVPNYGSQKVKLGVQLKTGAVVPPGTSLAGAVLSMEYTGSGVPSFGTAPSTCTTDASGLCPDVFAPDGYLVPAGESLTVTEVSAPTGLVAASVPQTVGPCVTDAPDPAAPSLPQCGDVTVLLDQTGPLPVAPPQSAQTPAGQPTTIGLPANAGNGAPVQSVTVTQAQHGTVSYAANAFTYRPNVGFSGRDSFTYTVHTANGDTTGTITVDVEAAATTAPATTAPAGTAPASSAPAGSAPASPIKTVVKTVPTSSAAVAPIATTDPVKPASTAALASTGASGVRDLTMGGAAMVLVGAAAVGLGRRRRTPATIRRH